MDLPRTLPELFFRAVERHDHPRFVQYKAGGQYEAIPAREFREEVELGAQGLMEWGVAAGDRVGLLSENRPGWGFADLSILCAGAWTVPIYPSLSAEEVEYILNDSGATACFVSTAEQLAKVDAVRERLPALKCVVVLDPLETTGEGTCPAHALVERGREARERAPGALAERLAGIDPEDTASILYTSGTTGKPKGVMLSHNNFVTNVIDSLEALAITSADTHLSFLPLCHSFERTAGWYIMMWAGTSIAYAESMDTIPQNLLEVRPTVTTSAPRLYEKMYAAVLQKASDAGGAKKRIAFWARRIGIEYAEAEVGGPGAGPWLKMRHRIADRLVFSKLRERTGGRLRFWVSGSAPLAPVIAKFFYAAGLPVLEGYGLTETSPVISVNTFEHMKFGSVGRPIDNVEVKIEPDPDRPGGDGEILVRGPNVMQGYYNLPEKTAQVMTEDGWLRTGDVGHLDDQGFLTITDRKKDLIKTSGGKYVAPQPLENDLKGSKYVSQAVVVGNRRKYASVLIVPNFDSLEDWARGEGLPADRETLLKSPEVAALYEDELEKVNRGRQSYETLKKFALLPEEFTLEKGELTPTLKVKRSVVEEKLTPLIDTLYEDEPLGER